MKLTDKQLEEIEKRVVEEITDISYQETYLGWMYQAEKEKYIQNKEESHTVDPLFIDEYRSNVLDPFKRSN